MSKSELITRWPEMIHGRREGTCGHEPQRRRCCRCDKPMPAHSLHLRICDACCNAPEPSLAVPYDPRDDDREAREERYQ